MPPMPLRSVATCMPLEPGHESAGPCLAWNFPMGPGRSKVKVQEVPAQVTSVLRAGCGLQRGGQARARQGLVHLPGSSSGTCVAGTFPVPQGQWVHLLVTQEHNARVGCSAPSLVPGAEMINI